MIPNNIKYKIELPLWHNCSWQKWSHIYFISPIIIYGRCLLTVFALVI